MYIKVASAEISEHTYSHILSLSMGWQLNAKIGKTIRAIDRGMDSVNTIVTYTFLTLIPTLAECLAVCAIFLVHYHQWDVSLLLLVGLWLFGELENLCVCVCFVDGVSIARHIYRYENHHSHSLLILISLTHTRTNTHAGIVTVKITNRRRFFRQLSNQKDSEIHVCTKAKVKRTLEG